MSFNFIRKWSQLRSIQNFKIVQSTYIWLFILPIVAKLLSKLESTLSLNIGGQTLVFDLQLPFAWKAFFISALLFTFANILFLYFSPDIVKENKDLGEFKAKAKNQYHLEWYMTIPQLKEWTEDLKIKKDEVLIGAPLAIAIDRDYPEHLREEEKALASKQAEFIDERFWKIHSEQNITKTFIRLIITILYLIAGLIFSYILLQNIYYVLIQF